MGGRDALVDWALTAAEDNERTVLVAGSEGNGARGVESNHGTTAEGEASLGIKPARRLHGEDLVVRHLGLCKASALLA